MNAQTREICVYIYTNSEIITHVIVIASKAETINHTN